MKIRKQYPAIVTMWLFALSIQAQTPGDTLKATYVMPVHSIYLEIGGASDFVGVNWDSRFKTNSHWGYRAGLAIGYESDNSYELTQSNTYYSAPVDVNLLIGRRKSRLELGLGLKPMLIRQKHLTVAPTATDITQDTYNISTSTTYLFRALLLADIGYRYVSKRGFQLRCGVTPMMNITKTWLTPSNEVDRGDLLLAPYVSFGWSF